MLTKKEMVALAQEQLDAYNKGDIDTFCKCYHPEVEAFQLHEKEPFLKGIENFKELYASKFKESPKLNAKLLSRIVLADHILDEEWVTGVINQNKDIHVIAIYSFKDGLISKIIFAR